jgi:hypothetical protein
MIVIETLTDPSSYMASTSGCAVGQMYELRCTSPAPHGQALVLAVVGMRSRR